MYKKINLYPKLLRETNQPIDRLNASLSTEKKRSKLKLKRIKRRPFFQLIGYTKFTPNISLFLIILMQHLNKTWLFIDIVINIWFNFDLSFRMNLKSTIIFINTDLYSKQDTFKKKKLKDSKFIAPIIEMNLSLDLCLPTALLGLPRWPFINKLKRWNIQFTSK